MNEIDDKFYGKYRGTVKINIDPQQRGRLRLLVPDVTGENLSSWALPCAPVAGRQNGMVALPVIGSQVWVEFEHGDSDYPIWVGGFWGEGEVPPLALSTPPGIAAITMQTEHQHGLTISDVPGSGGGIMLKSASGATLIVNDSGISLDNGKGATITLKGSTVSINGDALEVT
jgi:uncharacterized protein involved in type VI secretion and phage assembly